MILSNGLSLCLILPFFSSSDNRIALIIALSRFSDVSDTNGDMCLEASLIDIGVYPVILSYIALDNLNGYDISDGSIHIFEYINPIACE